MQLGPDTAWESTRGRGSGGAAAPFKILLFAEGIPDTSCSSLPLGFFSSKLQRSCLNVTFIIVINTTTASRHFLATFGISPPPLASYCHHSRVTTGTVGAKTEYPLKNGARRLLRADASFIIHCLCLGLPPGKHCWYLVEPGQLCRELGSPRCLNGLCLAACPGVSSPVSSRGGCLGAGKGELSSQDAGCRAVCFLFFKGEKFFNLPCAHHRATQPD